MNKKTRHLVNFEMKSRFLERFEAVLKDKGLNKSEVIRGLLNEYIEKNENRIKDDNI